MTSPDILECLPIFRRRPRRSRRIIISSPRMGEANRVHNPFDIRPPAGGIKRERAHVQDDSIMREILCRDKISRDFR